MNNYLNLISNEYKKDLKYNQEINFGNFAEHNKNINLNLFDNNINNFQQNRINEIENNNNKKKEKNFSSIINKNIGEGQEKNSSDNNLNIQKENKPNNKTSNNNINININNKNFISNGNLIDPSFRILTNDNKQNGYETDDIDKMIIRAENLHNNNKFINLNENQNNFKEFNNKNFNKVPKEKNDSKLFEIFGDCVNANSKKNVFYNFKNTRKDDQDYNDSN